MEMLRALAAHRMRMRRALNSSETLRRLHDMLISNQGASTH
jgi:hypothetical protein